MLYLLQTGQVNLPVPTDYTQWGVIGANVFVVIGFLWFLWKEREDRRLERQSFLQTIEKMIEDSARSSEETRKALERFTDILRGCPARDNLRSTHGR